VDGTTFVPAERRRVGMVFQDYALFPHLSVARNVAYGVGREDRRRRVAETLELVGLAGKENRLPHELSGGEQQRVALARALAPEPEVILLDEPFSNLDAALRTRVRSEVADILRRAGTTAVFVTHDQEEALSMSDFVAVMHEGRVVQAARPSDLYSTPLDAWVGSFLGEADFMPGVAREGEVETPWAASPPSSRDR
jgi:iron(III) transport system ATP-binding protein